MKSRFSYGLFAGVMVTLIFLAGCSTSRKVSTSDNHTSKMDSVRVVERVRIDTIRVASDTVRYKIPLSVIGSFTDTVFVFKSRVAKQEIKVSNGNLQFTSTCDSLEKLVLSYERELYRGSKFESNLKSTEKNIKRNRLPWWSWYLMGVFTVIVYITFKPLFKR